MSHRGRRVQRQRLLGPGADQRAGRRCSPRSTGSAPSAAPRSRAGSGSALSTIATAEARPRTDYYTNALAGPIRRQPTPVPKGTYASAIIVLLTDGENTTARPAPAAAEAADRGVRIDTVGIGSAAGTTLDVEGFRVHTPARRGALQADLRRDRRHLLHGRGRRRRWPRSTTRSTSELVVQPEPMEVTSLFAGAGVLLLLIGGLGSLAVARAGCRDARPDEPALAPRAARPAAAAGARRACASGPCAGGGRGLRYSSLSLIHEAMPRSSRIRRHLPFALFAARPREPHRRDGPTGRHRQPCRPARPRSSSRSTCRGSMCSTDIPPNRLLAAEARGQRSSSARARRRRSGSWRSPGSRRSSRRRPTTRRSCSTSSRASRPGVGRRSAAGSSTSIDAIAEIDPSVAKSWTDDPTAGRAAGAVPKGAYAPAIIVLLTDGASNAGPDPVDAGPQAADRGIRVYTIGFGTANPGAPTASCGAAVHRARAGRRRRRLRRGRWRPGSGRRPGSGAASTRTRCKAVADATGGEYYPAESADELEKVFADLPTNLITKHEVDRDQRRVRRGRRALLVGAGAPARPGLAPAAVERRVACSATVTRIPGTSTNDITKAKTFYAETLGIDVTEANGC